VEEMKPPPAASADRDYVSLLRHRQAHPAEHFYRDDVPRTLRSRGRHCPGDFLHEDLLAGPVQVVLALFRDRGFSRRGLRSNVLALFRERYQAC